MLSHCLIYHIAQSAGHGFFGSAPSNSDDDANVAANALRCLSTPDASTGYWQCEASKMPPDVRVAGFQELAQEFPDNMKEAHTPDISAKLNIAILRLDVESAAELWLTLQLKHDQWDGIAKGLNTLMPEGEKFKGGMLPRNERLIAYLKEQGGQLKAEDVEEVSNLLVEDDEASVVDVVSSDDDTAVIDVDLQDGIRLQATLESHSNHAPSKAYFARMQCSDALHQRCWLCRMHILALFNTGQSMAWTLLWQWTAQL
jgi:hypothetical protein